MRAKRHPMRPPTIRGIAVAVGVMALAVTGCSTTDDASDTTAMLPTTETVEVTATDFAYVGLPTEVVAGTALTLTNDSATELHELVAFRIPDNDTRTVDEIIQLPPEELGAFFANVAAVIIAPPNEEGFPVEGTGTLTEPGRYGIICAIPTGADPAEYLEAAATAEGGPPEVAGGPPHFVNGMFAELTVTG